MALDRLPRRIRSAPGLKGGKGSGLHAPWPAGVAAVDLLNRPCCTDADLVALTMIRIPPVSRWGGVEGGFVLAVAARWPLPVARRQRSDSSASTKEPLAFEGIQGGNQREIYSSSHRPGPDHITPISAEGWTGKEWRAESANGLGCAFNSFLSLKLGLPPLRKIERAGCGLVALEGRSAAGIEPESWRKQALGYRPSAGTQRPWGGPLLDVLRACYGASAAELG